jgi:FixJ family two-component response regulator
VGEVIRGFKQGAIDFIQKPFNMELLIQVLETSIEKQKVSLSKKYKLIVREERLARLTKRENETCLLMSKGYSNPKMAQELGLSIETVKQYKQNVYAKLELGDLSELIAFLHL